MDNVLAFGLYIISPSTNTTVPSILARPDFSFSGRRKIVWERD